MDDHEDDVVGDALGVVATTLLEVVRTLGRIEERLGHLEALMGATDEEGPSQSIQLRSWDPVAQRWVYFPQPS